jgi:hypothetical protein
VLLHTAHHDGVEAPASATSCRLVEPAVGEPAPQPLIASPELVDIAFVKGAAGAGAAAAARGGLAHAAHARRTHARAQQQPRSPVASLHSALQRRAAAARVAAAWDDSDEEEGGR